MEMIKRSIGWFTQSRKLAVVGSLVIACAVVLSYYPSVRVGFLGDDWWFLDKAASLNLPDYLAFYFNPSTQIFWYRPLYGIWLLFEYVFFRSVPEGYHVGQIFLHLVNCLLLFAVIFKLSKRWRPAWLAALVYAVTPVYSSAVFWIAVQDPLAMIFFLAAILAWVGYLESGNKWPLWIALCAYVLALLSKETGFFLVIVLFILDRWFIRTGVNKIKLVQRYLPFVFLLLVYLAIERQVQTNAYFPNRWGYSLGFHVIENMAHYLALLAFPWELDPPANYIWLGIVMVALVAVGIKRRSKQLLFLGIIVVLAIAPAVAFPTMFFFPRYLYAAVMASSILVALFFEQLRTHLPSSRVTRWAIAVAAILFVLFGSLNTSTMAEAAVEYGRQSRVPLRDIYQQHPSYPNGTYLYFVEPPYPMILRNLSGMFSLHYGSNVSVWSNDAESGGADEDKFAGLRDFQNTFVYYFDGSANRREVWVDPSAKSTSMPAMPVGFGDAINLDGYEVTSTTLKPGNDLVLLLYWRAKTPITRDYTVYVHLINDRGEMVLGEDSQPRGGRMPTTRWTPGKLVVDTHILTVASGTPVGRYHLEVGLYFLPTLERLATVDDTGRPMGDSVVINSFQIGSK
jgi:hypothetical protein